MAVGPRIYEHNDGRCAADRGQTRPSLCWGTAQCKVRKTCGWWAQLIGREAQRTKKSNEGNMRVRAGEKTREDHRQTDHSMVERGTGKW